MKRNNPSYPSYIHSRGTFPMLSRDPNLFRKPSNILGKQIRFWKRRMVEKNGFCFSHQKGFQQKGFRKSIHSDEWRDTPQTNLLVFTFHIPRFLIGSTEFPGLHPQITSQEHFFKYTQINPIPPNPPKSPQLPGFTRKSQISPLPVFHWARLFFLPRSRGFPPAGRGDPTRSRGSARRSAAGTGSWRWPWWTFARRRRNRIAKRKHQPQGTVSSHSHTHPTRPTFEGSRSVQTLLLILKKWVIAYN